MMRQVKTAALLLLIYSPLQAQGVEVVERITATNQVVIVEGNELGSTEIEWFTSEYTTAQVLVSAEGGPEKLFAQGRQGVKQAPWIRAGRAYRFQLYADVHQAELLAQTWVVGVDRFGGGTIWAAPDEVAVPRQGVGSSWISWKTNDLPDGAQVWGEQERPARGADGERSRGLGGSAMDHQQRLL